MYPKQLCLILFVLWTSVAIASEQAIDLKELCFPPEKASALLKKLRAADWQDIGREQIRELWAAQFRISEDCEVQDGESTHKCAIMSAGFCSNEVCYCNLAFDLQTKAGTAEKLHSMTLFYSNRDLIKVVQAAQLFVASLAPLTEKYSQPNNGWLLDETHHLSKMFGYNPDYSYTQGNTVYSGGDLGVQLKIYTLDNGISSVYLTVSDPAEVRPPKNSLERWAPP